MSDDLAALFAKKAQKRNKKKNVVNLDEVGQQLERKARIQETGERDIDENESKESKHNESKLTQSAEDSEWIEHTEKPSHVGLTFKEFTENPDELLEDEKKRANNESAKTWQTIKEEAPVELPKPAPPRAYQAPQARRGAPLDITNEEMFPSIAAADVIAEKLKVDEKKKIATPIGPPEEQFQEAKKNVYRPPRGTDQQSSGIRGGPPSSGGYRSSDGPSRFGGGGRPTLDSSESEKPEERNWRTANVTPSPSVGRGGGGGGLSSTPASSQDDGASNWRSATRAIPANPPRFSDTPRLTDTTAGDGDGSGGNWRSSKPASETPVAAPATSETTPSGSAKYVPPRMRGKT